MSQSGASADTVMIVSDSEDDDAQTRAETALAVAEAEAEEAVAEQNRRLHAAVAAGNNFLRAEDARLDAADAARGNVPNFLRDDREPANVIDDDEDDDDDATIDGDAPIDVDEEGYGSSPLSSLADIEPAYGGPVLIRREPPEERGRRVRLGDDAPPLEIPAVPPRPINPELPFNAVPYQEGPPPEVSTGQERETWAQALVAARGYNYTMTHLDSRCGTKPLPVDLVGRSSFVPEPRVARLMPTCDSHAMFRQLRNESRRVPEELHRQFYGMSSPLQKRVEDHDESFAPSNEYWRYDVETPHKELWIAYQQSLAPTRESANEIKNVMYKFADMLGECDRRFCSTCYENDGVRNVYKFALAPCAHLACEGCYREREGEKADSLVCVRCDTPVLMHKKIFFV